MSFLINPYIYNAFVPIDFSGLNLTRIWALFKTSEATVNYGLEIARDLSGVDIKTVFYDTNGDISGNSPTGADISTPSATDTLQDFIDLFPASTIRVTKIYCQITGLALQEGGTTAPRIYDGSTLNLTNSKLDMVFRDAASGYLRTATVLTEMDSGDDFSVSAVANVDATSTSATPVLTINRNDTSNNNAAHTLFIDRDTSKRIGRYRTTAPVNVFNDYTAQQTTAAQRRLVSTVEGTVEMKGYYNGTLHDTDAVTGTFDNAGLTVGCNSDDSGGRLKGGIQFIGIHDVHITGTQVTTLDARLDDYFSF